MKNKIKDIWLILLTIVGAVLVVVTFTAILTSLHSGNQLTQEERQQQLQEMEALLNEEKDYDDGCKASLACKKCKLIDGCVSCMNDCYNRFGQEHDVDNRLADRAKGCNAQCYTNEYGGGLKVDFNIDMKRNK